MEDGVFVLFPGALAGEFQQWWRFGYGGPQRHAARGFGFDVATAVADELSDSVECHSRSLPWRDVWCDECFDAFGFGQQSVFVPVCVDDVLESLEVASSGFGDLVELVSDQSLGFDREGCLAVDGQFAVFFELAIGSPGDEVKAVGFRVVVDEEVVGIGAVPVPEPQQAFDGPVGVEGIQVDQLTDISFEIIGIGWVVGRRRGHRSFEHFDQSFHLFSSPPIGLGVVELVFEAAFPSVVEVDDASFVESPGVVAEFAFHHWFVDAFDMSVEPDVFSVDGDLGVGTAGSGRSGGVVDRVPHRLAHQRHVLLVVVESQVGQSAGVGLSVDVVDLDLQRRPVGVLRSDESFFAESHVGEFDPVDRHLGVDVDVG